MKHDTQHCVFCAILAGRVAAEIVHRDAHCVVLLDAFPLTRGHLLVVALRHAEHLEDLPEESAAQLFRVGARCSAAWRGDGAVRATNFLLNNGQGANQHVPHVHLHIIPRRRGDTPLLLWRQLTRFLNPLAALGRRERLARDAARVRALLAACGPA